MRVIYLHQYFNTPDIGGSTRSYEFARRLAEAGHDVHVITTNRAADRSRTGWTTAEMELFTVHSIGIPYSNEMSFGTRILSFFRFAVMASFRARKLGGDVVFATSTPLTVAIPAIYATALSRRRMVFEVRDLWPTVPIAMGALKGRFTIAAARLLERAAYRASTEVVALSEDMKTGVASTGYDARRITVIPNAADLDLFGGICAGAVQRWLLTHPELQDRRFVLYCGALGYVNGVSYLADVAKFARAIDPTVAFVVVGSGAEKQRVLDRATEQGVLDDNFFYYPRIAKSEVPVVFAASSITTSLVVPVPELEANSANKFFDSLAAGRPIAINHGGWQLDVLGSNDAGLGLPADSPERAAEILVRCINDDTWLRDVGANARSLAEREYSRDDLARQLLGVLKRAATKSHR